MKWNFQFLLSEVATRGCVSGLVLAFSVALASAGPLGGAAELEQASPPKLDSLLAGLRTDGLKDGFSIGGILYPHLHVTSVFRILHRRARCLGGQRSRPAARGDLART